MAAGCTSGTPPPTAPVSQYRPRFGRGGRDDAADVSMQSLKDYLRHHPARQAEILNRNERYVFFRNVASGPTGSTGLVLTAGRSVAADPTIYPPGRWSSSISTARRRRRGGARVHSDSGAESPVSAGWISSSEPASAPGTSRTAAG